jgi:hypothetical protein
LVLFVALKLCGVIAWSWIWVIAPVWIPLAFCVALGLSIRALDWYVGHD